MSEITFSSESMSFFFSTAENTPMSPFVYNTTFLNGLETMVQKCENDRNFSFTIADSN